MYRIAVIEDHEPTNNDFTRLLKNIWSDCHVEQYFDSQSAIAAIEEASFDLIVSDIDLGDGTDKYGGMKIAKSLHGKNIPILIISGSSQPELQRDIFRALDAWDYLQKPIKESDFRTQVIRAITFRKAQQDESSDDLAYEDRLKIDSTNKVTVTWKGERVYLSFSQIRLLQLLVKNRGVNTSYEQLYTCLNSGTNKENVRVHIREIRRAFEEVDPEFKCVQTAPLVGYRWQI